MLEAPTGDLPVNDRSWEALDYQIYILDDESSENDDVITDSILKWRKSL